MGPHRAGRDGAGPDGEEVALSGCRGAVFRLKPSPGAAAPPQGLFAASAGAAPGEEAKIFGKLLTSKGAIRYNKRVAEKHRHGPIAQLDRAFDYESKGRRFESYWGHQDNPAVWKGCLFCCPSLPPCLACLGRLASAPRPRGRDCPWGCKQGAALNTCSQIAALVGR